jgi:hypothetical protein
MAWALSLRTNHRARFYVFVPDNLDYLVVKIRRTSLVDLADFRRPARIRAGTKR